MIIIKNSLKISVSTFALFTPFFPYISRSFLALLKSALFPRVLLLTVHGIVPINVFRGTFHSKDVSRIDSAENTHNECSLQPTQHADNSCPCLFTLLWVLFSSHYSSFAIFSRRVSSCSLFCSVSVCCRRYFFVTSFVSIHFFFTYFSTSTFFPFKTHSSLPFYTFIHLQCFLFDLIFIYPVSHFSSCSYSFCIFQSVYQL